ncbi:MAG: hypothetical protein COA79_26465, partial [Planctomycetota bacterium]
MGLKMKQIIIISLSLILITCILVVNDLQKDFLTNNDALDKSKKENPTQTIKNISILKKINQHLSKKVKKADDKSQIKRNIDSIKDKGEVSNASNFIPAESTPKEIEQFNQWFQKYKKLDKAAKDKVVEVGLQLVKERRLYLKTIIQNNPKKAIELSMSEWDQKDLPPSIKEQMETHINAMGEYQYIISTPLPGKSNTMTERYFVTDILTYDVYPFDKGLDAPSKLKTSVRGISIDNKMAMKEKSSEIIRGADIAKLKILKPHLFKKKLPHSNEIISDSVTSNDQQYCDCDTPSNINDHIALYTGGKIYYESTPNHIENDEHNLVLQLGGSSGSSSIVMSTTNSEGDKKILYIRMDFSDNTGDPVSFSYLDNLLNVRCRNFYLANSYGKMTSFVGTITPTYRAPSTQADYSAGISEWILYAQAKVLALNDGYDSADYDKVIVAFRKTYSGGWAGRAYVNSKKIVLNGYYSFRETAHELGHTFGLQHANLWSTTGSGTIIGEGSNNEYRNQFDVMGNATTNENHHFTAAFKHQLDYLTDNDVHQATTSGTYRIVAHDKEDISAMKGGIMVPLEGLSYYDKKYFIGFRQRFTSNVYQMNGIGLHWQDGSKCQLLDTTPGTGSHYGTSDSALTIGRTFTDTFNNIHITPIGKGGTTPESIDVVINIGPFPANNAPTYTLTASSTSTTSGTNITFNAASAIDADGDTLAFYWNFGDGNISFDNASSQTKSFSSDGEYLVRCIVSDRKGGVSIQTIVITIGTLTTFQISGTVLDSSSNPVEGVLLKWNNLITYSDSIGNYLFTNLATNSANIYAFKVGYDITKNGFSNPVAVGPNQTGKNWIADIGEISGTVTLDGNPLPSCTVNYSGASKGNVTTAADGTYKISGLPGGGYTFKAKYNSASSTTRSITMPAIYINQDFSFTSNTISGNITDFNTTSPIDEAKIFYNYLGTKNATSDVNGDYAINLIIGSPQTIDVWAGKAGGYVIAEKQSISVPPSQSNINFALKRGEYGMTIIQPLAGGSYTIVNALNNLNDVVGWAKDASGTNHPYFWRSDTETTIKIGSSANGGFAISVNDAREVAGHFNDTSWKRSAFYWNETDGTTDLGNLGGSFSDVSKINSAGQIIGISHDGSGITKPYFWSKSTGMIDIGLLPGASYGSANNINDLGQVVGHCSLGSGEFKAFFWSISTGLIDIGNLGGSPQNTVATAINKNGIVVGSSTNAINATMAFEWDQTNGIRSLGTLGHTPIANETVSNTSYISPYNYISGSNKNSLGNPRIFLGNFDDGINDIGTLGGPISYLEASSDMNFFIGQSDSTSATNVYTLWRPVLGLKALLPLISSEYKISPYQYQLNNKGSFAYNVWINGEGRAAVSKALVNLEPFAAKQATTVTMNSPKALTLIGLDPENAPLTYTIVSSPTDGTLSGTGSNITYTPDTNYTGGDSFTFEVDDGSITSNPATVTLNITSSGTHSIVASNGSNGSISPLGSITVLNGNNQSFSISPDSGYQINDVLVDSSSVGAITSYTFTNITTNHTIHATFNALPTYTVTYNGNTNTGGSLPTDGNNYLNGATATVLGNSGSIVKTGFSFNGWNTAANGSGTSYAAASSLTMGSSNVTLYAKWSALPTYSVTYNGNTNTGGSVPADGNNYLNGATATVLGNSGTLVKTGYSFNGWNTASNGSGTSYVASSSLTMGSSNVTLYAKWSALPTYTVTYNGNTNTGGSAPTDANNYLNGATATVLGNSGSLVKTGFSFNGWNTASNGSGTSYAASSSLTMGSSNVTLYAKWIALPTYTVTYNGNTNTGGSVPTDANNYLNGATATVLGNSGSLVKTGFSFVGWNSAANGSGSSYAAASSLTMGSSNVTLYAKWSALPTYSVTYNGNTNTGGSAPTDGSNYLNGATATVLGNSGSLVKTGFSFVGWNTAANGSGTSYAASSSLTMGSLNITLYAKWTALPTYTVTYNGNTNTGGSVPADANNYLNGATVTILGNSGSLAKTGYSFNGWNTTANGSGSSYAASSSLTMGSSNVTLYAKWTALPTYTVTYNGNTNIGGSVPTDANNYLNGATVTVLTNSGTLAKTGFTFNNWNTAANGSGTSYASSSSLTMGSANVTLYAQWTALATYTITASNGSNGTITPTGALIVITGSNKTFTMTPNAGYEVDTVTVDGGSAGNVSSYTFSNVTANHTINVSFKIKTYNIISSAGSNGSINPNGSTSANHGSNQS